jgi:hypothetical protein
MIPPFKFLDKQQRVVSKCMMFDGYSIYVLCQSFRIYHMISETNHGLHDYIARDYASVVGVPNRRIKDQNV